MIPSPAIRAIDTDAFEPPSSALRRRRIKGRMVLSPVTNTSPPLAAKAKQVEQEEQDDLNSLVDEDTFVQVDAESNYSMGSLGSPEAPSNSSLSDGAGPFDAPSTSPSDCMGPGHARR